MSRYLEVELPNNFMNVGVTNNNELIADTNDSANWDTLKFPLPKGVWRIHSYTSNLEIGGLIDNGTKSKTILKLIDSRGWLRRFLEI